MPFLLMWAFTGTNFELPVLRHVTDALLPGANPADDAPVFASLKPHEGAREITEAQAAGAARALVGGGRIVSVTQPVKGDPAATWSFCVDHGFNWWRAYPGCPADKFVAVDRYDAGRAADTWHTDNAAQTLYGKQSEAAHFGAIVGWPLRIVLPLMGLVPLLLAFTGLSTLLFRRSKRRAKRRRAWAAA